MLRNFEPDRVYKPRDYLIIFWLMIALTSVSYFMLYSSENKDSLIILGFGLLGSLFLLLCYTCTSINFVDNEIIYKTMFKKQSMSFIEITKIETIAKIKGISTHGVEGEYKTKLYTMNSEINIHIKPYSKKDMTDFSKILIENAINAKVDETTHEMTKGYMPSIYKIKSKFSW